MTNDPRFVAVVSEWIDDGPKVWVKGEALQAGTKTLVIFTENQVRFYPLTDERRSGGKPIAFHVGSLDHIQPSDHLIHEGQGIAVYVPVASRQERVQWTIDRMRPTSLLDHLDVITELQHLICHRTITTGLVLDINVMERFQAYLRYAIVFNDTAERLRCAGEAIKAGQSLGIRQGG